MRLQEQGLQLKNLNSVRTDVTEILRGILNGTRRVTVLNLTIIAEAVCALAENPQSAGVPSNRVAEFGQRFCGDLQRLGGVTRSAVLEPHFVSNVLRLAYGLPFSFDQSLHPSAYLDVVIWNPLDSERQGVSIDVPGVLPLVTGDLVRINVALNRSAHIYLLWFSGDSIIQPVYPWRDGSWDLNTQSDRARLTVELPEFHAAHAICGWPLDEVGGTEIVLLLLRDQPLPLKFDLKQKLSGFPRTELASISTQTVRFSWRAPRVLTQFHALKLKNPVPIGQANAKIFGYLQDKLVGSFVLVEGISFQNSIHSIR